MNLFLALFWLICAVALLAYEFYIGGGRSRVQVGNISFSRTWLMIAAALMMAAYNLWRWRRLRTYRLRQRSLEIDRAKREWGRRRTERTEPPDPNFNFTDESPPPPNRDITDQPPSNN